MKIVTLVSEIIKFLGFPNTKISKNHQLLPPFGEKNLTPIKLLNLTVGGDDLAKNCFVSRDLVPINIFK